MTRRATRVALVFAALAAPQPAAAVTLSSGSGDSLNLGCPSPPGLELWPGSPNVAFAACTSFVLLVAPFRVDPALPLAEEPNLPVFLLPADLNGPLPDPAGSVFIDDFWFESAGRGWVTTTGHETVVPFVPTAGAAIDVTFDGVVRLSIPTRHTILGAFTRSDGTPIASFATRFTSGVLRVGSRLLVTTSNFQTTGVNPVLNPGTVLIFEVDDSNPALLEVDWPEPNDPDSGFVITTDRNPTALTPLAGGLVAVTNSGAVALTNPPSVATPGSVDILDPEAGAILASIPLGFAGPAYRQIAVDPNGAVGVLGSAVFRRLYAIDLRGLDALPIPAANPRAERPSCNDPNQVDAGGIPCLPGRVIAGEGNPIAVPPCPTCGAADDGFTVDAEFGASGDFLLATAFNDGLAAFVPFDGRALWKPHPLLAGRFGAASSHVLTAPIGTFGQETGPGPMLLRASPAGMLPDTGVLFLTNGPSGRLIRATASGAFAPPAPDADGDGIEDPLDNCPAVANPGQADKGALGRPGPDEIGDACQCGDVGGDAFVEIDDAARIARELASLAGGVVLPDRCNVAGLPGGAPARCDAADALRIRQGLALGEVWLPQQCGAATPP